MKTQFSEDDRQGRDARRGSVYFEHCVQHSPRVRDEESIQGTSSPVLEPSALQFGAFWMTKGDEKLRVDLTQLWHRAAIAGAPVAFRYDDPLELVRQRVDEIVDQAESGKLHLLLLYWSGQVTGSLILQTERGVLPTTHGVLSRIVVRSDLQRRGLGTSLLEIAADRARRMSLNTLFLTVRDKSGLASFYFRRGWVPVGRWQDGIKMSETEYYDEVVMQRMV